MHIWGTPASRQRSCKRICAHISAHTSTRYACCARTSLQLGTARRNARRVSIRRPRQGGMGVLDHLADSFRLLFFEDFVFHSDRAFRQAAPLTLPFTPWTTDFTAQEALRTVQVRPNYLQVVFKMRPRWPTMAR